ncbi:GntR family transcriptional regulator [Leptospira interrogans]
MEAAHSDTANDHVTGLPMYRLIAVTLESNIRAGNLPEGTVINETTLSQVFGTSRVPAAAALRELEDNGLVTRLPTRGFKIGGGTSKPRRINLLEAGLVLPEGFDASQPSRSHRSRLYPQVEREIAACLTYGKFLVNESGLARAYGVSRTVAHEILVRLERLDIARLEGSRWYVGPLSLDDLYQRYEMRWLLEPPALVNAAPSLNRQTIEGALRKVERYVDVKKRPAATRILELEQDLHINMVLECTNSEMRSAIYRSQLPLLSTHYTFEAGTSVDEIHSMAREHVRVFTKLLEGDVNGAAIALEQHLKSAFEVLTERFHLTKAGDWEPPEYMSREA